MRQRGKTGHFNQAKDLDGRVKPGHDCGVVLLCCPRSRVPDAMQREAVQQLSQMDAQELRQVLGELNLPSWVRSVAWRHQCRVTYLAFYSKCDTSPTSVGCRFSTLILRGCSGLIR